MKRCLILLLCLEFCKVLAIGPFSPKDEQMLYPINSLNIPGELFPLGGEMPSGRVHQSITALTDYLVVYGGYALDGSILGDINLFNIPVQKWTGPIVRTECCNSAGENIETIGSDQIYIKFPHLKVGFQGDFPLPRAEHSSCAVNDKMYIFGGVTKEHGLVNDLYTFNCVSLKWAVIDFSTGPNYPCRRAGHSMIGDTESSSFYLFGGRTTSRSTSVSDGVVGGLNDMWKYDTLRKSWILLSKTSNNLPGSTPCARQHTAMTLINGDIYIFGGIDPTNGLVFNDVWVFHIALQVWELLFNNHVNSGVYQFSPPPLYDAHMIPIPMSLDPNATIKGNSTANLQNSNSTSSFTKETINTGFLIYGGVGGGGNCGNEKCDILEQVLGQVYRFSLTQAAWTDGDGSSSTSTAHTVTGRTLSSNADVAGASNKDGNSLYNSESQYIQHAVSVVSPHSGAVAAKGSLSWNYARLSASSNHDAAAATWDTSSSIVDRGKLIKSFALEKVVFVPSRNLLYEFGGMMATKDSVISNNQETVIQVAVTTSGISSSITGYTSDNVAKVTTNKEISSSYLLQDAASGKLPDQNWDRFTGEQLRERVELPTNRYWNYSQAFVNSYRSGDSSDKQVVFIRAFRTYTVSSDDIVQINVVIPE